MYQVQMQSLLQRSLPMKFLVLILCLILETWPCKALAKGSHRKLAQQDIANSDIPTNSSNYVNGTLVRTLEVGIVQQECILTYNVYLNPYTDGSEELVNPMENIQNRVDNCCASCHSNDKCNAWQWCPLENGCTAPPTIYPPPANVTLTFPYHGCQLMYIDKFSPSSQNITGIRMRGKNIPFVAGTPFDLEVPQQEGYELDLGSDLGSRFDYSCTGSALPQACVVVGNASVVAAACRKDAACMAFTYYPLGTGNPAAYNTSPAYNNPDDDYSTPVGFLKKRADGIITNNYTELNPSAAVYIKISTLAQPLVTKAVEDEQGHAHIVVVAVSVSVSVVLVAAMVAAFIYSKRYRRMRKTLSNRASSEGTPVASNTTSPSSSLVLAEMQQNQGRHQQQSSRHQQGTPESSQDLASTSTAFQSFGRDNTPSPPQAGNNQQGLVSPFMFLGPAEIAAMMAAAPQVADVPLSGKAILTAGQDQSGDFLVSPSGTVSGASNTPAASFGRAPPPATGTARELLDVYSRLQQSRVPLVPVDKLADALSNVPLAHDDDDDDAEDNTTLDATNLLHLEEEEEEEKPQEEEAASTPMALELPPDEWVIKPEDVQLCQPPDGKNSFWQLGTGAYGTVYKATLRKTQPVAVKILHRTEDARHVADFQKEILMLRSLEHRHVVRFLGACFDGRSAMLVTELMELGDLWSALPAVDRAGERIFSWYRRGQRVVLDLARGLDYLHSRRIVHMDLKSANILLTRTGVAKIADVGMARVINKSYLSLISGGAGTFAWSSPELLSNKRCDEKVDIYSLGVVIWEVCTGHAPVRGDMRPLQAPEDCPQEIVDLYQQCTAELPEERPTARQVVDTVLAVIRRDQRAASSSKRDKKDTDKKQSIGSRTTKFFRVNRKK